MKKKSLIQLASPNDCTACTACVSVCPKQCISMYEDKEGFLQPKIDASVCIECHKCEKTCPVLLRKNNEWPLTDNSVQRGYAAYNKNEEERLRSSSGGIAPLLSHYIIQNDGVVVGVGFDEKWQPTYLIIDREEDIWKIQGSKYAQAYMNVEMYSQIRLLLEDGRLVMFTGLACQIEGLRTYLNCEYENLLLVDLICLGISSPSVWRDYLDTCTHGENIKYINFKDKKLGWHRFSVRIETDKKIQSLTGSEDCFMQSFFRTISLRRSCFNCPRRTVERVADITLADCWGVYEKVPELDDNKGLSAVIIHSQKGQRYFNNIDTICKEVSLNDVVKGNPNMIRNIKPQFYHRTRFHVIRKYISKRFAFIAYCKYNSICHMVYDFCRKIAKKLRINKILNPSYWRFNYKIFKSRYDYDMRLNTKWFGHTFTKEELDLYEIRYLKAYRLAQAAKGSIWFGLFYKKLKRLSLKSGIGLHSNLNINHGIIIGHAGTIVVNGDAIFNGNIMITHGVTIGRDIRGKRAGTPIFGHNVVLRTNSVIVGNITIGDDVLIAPNTFVNFDVPSHSIVIGNPATIHPRENATEGHIACIDE